MLGPWVVAVTDIQLDPEHKGRCTDSPFRIQGKPHSQATLRTGVCSWALGAREPSTL